MIDNVCMCVETEFVSKLITDIETQCFLYGVSLQPSELSALLKENPEIRRRTTRLFEKKQQLEKALLVFNERAPDIPSSHLMRRYQTDDQDEGIL